MKIDPTHADPRAAPTETTCAAATNFRPGEAGRTKTTSPEPVLLYDGECGLCTALAGWALRRSRRSGRLFVAPLQGPTAQGLLRVLGLPTEDFDTLVFVADRHRPVEGGCRLRSDGALAVFAALGGGWRVVAAGLRVIPRSWRDAGYRGVARVRRRLFGGPRPLRAGDAARRVLE